jgi:enoyl-CoA hydratase
MEYKFIIYKKEDGIATVTLNRPGSMNALNTDVFAELQDVFTRTELDDDVRVVVLAGSDKFFAAGADIAELANITTPLEVLRFAKFSRNVFRQIEATEKPLIAAVSGFALGGGCELTLVCDLRIAAQSAVFGLPEIKIGVFPGGGGTQRLPRLIGTTKAKELLYTGDNIDAQEAYRIGLVNKVVPGEKLLEETYALAKKIAARPAAAIKMTKFAVDGGINMDIKSAVAYEARCFEILFSTNDQKEGMKAFMEKRKAVFQGK